MDKDTWCSKMVINTTENGLKDLKVDLGSIILQIMTITKVNGKMGKEMGKVFTTGRMVKLIKAFGWKTKCMVSVSLLMLMEMLLKVNSDMIKKFDSNLLN